MTDRLQELVNALEIQTETNTKLAMEIAKIIAVKRKALKERAAANNKLRQTKRLLNNALAREKRLKKKLESKHD